ncbi:hypothetical protein BCR33DRAFT_739787 [Rhizoclosmatium globosum]|uniref:Uncharacterized protein n=1 Tax=Rhizoclosmatium globosum TaxID=329046 RepID=A0A1Y2C324_9FUNG|nr:hypothetical protein BCR33DRAFT_739787 [Rhizoclosmatium globosum]|eukprot:ORY41284.1 hypothetical protein BCR33DRAFT_739787 [Rhizoclosmatium globosum]
MTVTQQSVCETINAFSPKCGAYFASLSSNDKANLIGTICSSISSNRVPRANLQPTFDYYQSLAVHDSCDSGPALCSTSPQSPANFDWFKTQPLPSQITCILNICANQTFATPSLANAYSALDPTINSVTKGYETACLEVRDSSKLNVIAQYYPNFNTTAVQGSYLTTNNNAVPILDLVQLNDTMNGLTSFLTTGYPASLDWVTQRVSSWQNTYNAFTYDQFMSSIGNMNNSNISPTSMIWFKAQNLTSQKHIIGDLCANSMTEAQKQLIFYFLAHYMAIGDSVYNTITECPAVINLLQPFKINIYFISSRC